LWGTKTSVSQEIVRRIKALLLSPRSECLASSTDKQEVERKQELKSYDESGDEDSMLHIQKAASAETDKKLKEGEAVEEMDFDDEITALPPLPITPRRLIIRRGN
jgi:hypothetical protein